MAGIVKCPDRSVIGLRGGWPNTGATYRLSRAHDANLDIGLSDFGCIVDMIAVSPRISGPYIVQKEAGAPTTGFLIHLAVNGSQYYVAVQMRNNIGGAIGHAGPWITYGGSGWRHIISLFADRDGNVYGRSNDEEAINMGLDPNTNIDQDNVRRFLSGSSLCRFVGQRATGHCQRTAFQKISTIHKNIFLLSMYDIFNNERLTNLMSLRGLPSREITLRLGQCAAVGHFNPQRPIDSVHQQPTHGIFFKIFRMAQRREEYASPLVCLGPCNRLGEWVFVLIFRLVRVYGFAGQYRFTVTDQRFDVVEPGTARK